MSGCYVSVVPDIVNAGPSRRLLIAACMCAALSGCNISPVLIDHPSIQAIHRESTRKVTNVTLSELPLISEKSTGGDDAVTPVVFPLGTGTVSPPMQFAGQSEISFSLPAEARTFMGTLTYRLNHQELSASELAVANQVLVRIFVDGSLLLETVLDRETPARSFTLPVQGQVLTIDSKIHSGSDRFYLMDSMVTDRVMRSSTVFLPAADTGYVSLAPLPRQALFGAYYAGEAVSLAVAYAAVGAKAEVEIAVAYDAPVLDWERQTLEAPLKVFGSIRQGLATWRVPARMGPAYVRVTQRVAGRIVFERRTEIVVMAPPNRVAGEPFPVGIHVSSAGYALLSDEFAGLFGTRYARIILRWPLIEPQPGEFDFYLTDQLLHIYEKQRLTPVLVLGEDAPSWVRLGEPRSIDQWRSYVSAVVSRYRERVRFWEVYNEPDVKYFAGIRGVDPDADALLLRSGLDAITEQQPDAIKICCATGTVSWLSYMRRMAAAGVLSDVSILSLHTYEPAPPELKHGNLTLPGRFQALSNIAGTSVAGGTAPIWSTEGNWLLPTQNRAQAAGAIPLSQHQQAEYLVRASLLAFAQGGAYFVHMPFIRGSHAETSLDAMAALNATARIFAGTTAPRLLHTGPDVFAVVAESQGKSIAALWSVSGRAVISLDPSPAAEMFDMYGNPLRQYPETLALGSSPLFYSSLEGPPQLTVLEDYPGVPGTELQPFTLWWHNPAAAVTAESDAIDVRSSPSQYEYQLVSSPLALTAGECYRFTTTVGIREGTLGIFAADAVTGRQWGVASYADAEEGAQRTADLRFIAPSNPVKIVIGNANLAPRSTTFELGPAPQVAPCEPGLGAVQP